MEKGVDQLGRGDHTALPASVAEAGVGRGAAVVGGMDAPVVGKRLGLGDEVSFSTSMLSHVKTELLRETPYASTEQLTTIQWPVRLFLRAAG